MESYYVKLEPIHTVHHKHGLLAELVTGLHAVLLHGMVY